MTAIITNSASIDYFTITTYRESAGKAWWNLLHTYPSGEITESKQMQYDGRMYRGASGSLFVGSGYQKATLHHMIRASGPLADELSTLMLQQVAGYDKIRVTRLDLQVTIDEPAGYQQQGQWRLFNRLKDAGHTVGWHESGSKGGQLETVYCGSRTSNRFTRIYTKLTAANNRLLRFETEYKSDRAHRIAEMLGSGKNTVSQFVRHELETVVSDEQLERMFVPLVEHTDPTTAKIRHDSDTDKTVNWLLYDVLPVFIRMLNDHDRAQDIAEAYAEEVNRWANSLPTEGS